MAKNLWIAVAGFAGVFFVVGFFWPMNYVALLITLLFVFFAVMAFRDSSAVGCNTVLERCVFTAISSFTLTAICALSMLAGNFIFWLALG